MIRNQCNACPEEGIVKINDRWWCTDHIARGFREATGPLREALSHLQDPPDEPSQP